MHVEEIEKIFPNKFEYIEEFKNSKIKIKINCKVKDHGIFTACPSSLKSGKRLS